MDQPTRAGPKTRSRCSTTGAPPRRSLWHWRRKRRTLGPKGAFNTDANKWATANNVSYPYIEYDGAVAAAPAVCRASAGALQEALNASDDMKSTMGIYDAALGRDQTKHRAAPSCSVRESDTATFNYIDNLSRAIRHAGRVMVDLIPKVYQRAAHHPRDSRGWFQRVRPYQSAIHARPGQSPQAQAYEAGKTQETVDGLTRIYDVTTGKYDVTCEAGPSFSTKREEAAAQMMELGRMFPPMMQVAGDLLVKNLIGLERTILPTDSKPCLPPQLQGQSPQVMQMRQQMQQMDQMAKQAVGQLNQQIAQLQQQLQQEKSHDAQAMLQADIDRKKLEIDEYNAVTNRMKVTARP